MKIQILSDLHLEFEYKIEGYESPADIIVLAGDIDIHSRILFSLTKFYDEYKKPIIYIPGNHEYYKTYKAKMDYNFERFNKEQTNIHVLNDDWIKFDDVYFIGSTGWWDESNGLVYPSVTGMSDYHYIKDLVRNNNGIDWGVKSKKFFETTLEQFKNEKTVCISHNGVINLPSDRFKGSSLNTCFFNNWSDLLDKYSPNYWIHGHTHDNIDKTVYDTRIICNPKGYVEENRNFNPSLVIEV